MGAANVGAVLLTWHDLSHRAHRVLVAMAHMSLDTARPDAPARRYFGGPGYLAEVLYGPAGVDGRDERGEAIPTKSARRQVEKCVTELVRAGALQRIVKGAPGRRAVYEVVLSRPTEHPTETVVRHPTETVGNTRPDRSVRATETVGPRNHRNQEEQGEEKNNSLHHSQTREASAGDEQEISEHYADATAFLARTIGTGPAGDETATWLLEHPDTGYMTAVVSVAQQRGWSP